MTTQSFMNDTFKQLSDSFAKTFEMSARFQEDTAKFWSDAFSKTTDDCRSQWKQAADEVVPLTQQNLDRFHALFEAQTKRNMDLLQHALDCAAPGKPAEMNERLMDLWRASFEAMRESTDAAAKANTEMVDAWTDTVGKTRPAAGNGAKTARTSRKGK